MSDTRTAALWWLHLSFRLGAIVDFIMLFPMLIPSVGAFMFGIVDEKLKEKLYNVEYSYAMYIAASLMFGWTLLLLWCDQKPFERKDILLLTVFPVIFGLALSGYYISILNPFIPIKEMIPIWCLQFTLSIIFIYSYIKASNVKLKN